MRVMASVWIQLREIFAIDIDVFVAAAGEVDDEDFVLGGGRAADGFGDGVGGFERRDDALGARQAAGGGQRFGVAGGDVLGAVAIVQPGVLGADHGVIEAGGDGVRERDLAVVVLQQVAVGAVQDAGSAAAKARGVLAERVAAAAGFDADQLRPSASRMKAWKMPMALLPPPTQAMSGSGRRPSASRICRAGFLADDAVEIAHHHAGRDASRARSRAGNGCRRRW